MAHGSKDLPLDAYPYIDNDLKSGGYPTGDYITRLELNNILNEYEKKTELETLLANYPTFDETIKYCLINFGYKNYNAYEEKGKIIFRNGEVVTGTQSGTYIFSDYNPEIEKKIIGRIPVLISKDGEQQYLPYNINNFQFYGFEKNDNGDISAKIKNVSNETYDYSSTTIFSLPAVLILIKGD